MKREMSAAQEELIELGTAPVVNPLELSVVKVYRTGKGVSHAAKEAQDRAQKNSRIPGNYHLCGVGPWNCVQSMLKIVRPEKKNGSGYLDTIWKAMELMKLDRPHGLVFFIDDARGMKPSQMENLMAMIGWSAMQMQVNVRVILLLARSRVWNQEKGKREEMFLHSHALEARAHGYSWCDPDSKNPEGLFDLQKGQRQHKFDWARFESEQVAKAESKIA
jgi:hypothetical protein